MNKAVGLTLHSTGGATVYFDVAMPQSIKSEDIIDLRTSKGWFDKLTKFLGDHPTLVAAVTGLLAGGSSGVATVVGLK